MTRNEAIEILSCKEEVENMHIKSPLVKAAIWEAIERLKEPVTLAEFLGWEEGVEYDFGGDIMRITDDALELYDNVEEYFDFCDYYWTNKNINELRKAKKVETKPKAWRVRDEYSLEHLVKELQDQGFEYKGMTLKEHMEIKKNSLKRDGVTYLCIDEDTGINGFDKNYSLINQFEIIDYHKEEPKYYAKIKGGDLIENGNCYFRWHKQLKTLTLGNNIRCAGNKEILDHYMTKSQWEEHGVDDSKADFERVTE